MDKRKAENLTDQIISLVSTQSPVIGYEKPLPDEYMYVMEKFLRGIGLYEVAEAEYIEKLLKAGKLLSAAEFEANPYILNVKVGECTRGEYMLTEAAYERGEILSYDMPGLVPRLGFFDRRVTFPAVYEGNMPWMSVCPTEIATMKEPVEKASGRMLVLGLGLGYYPYMISLKDDVTQIDIIECSREVIGLFEEEILPQFSHGEKIHIILDDAMSFLEEVRPGEYDGVFADIWESQVDGAFYYPQLKRQEERLSGTVFNYWIEEPIREYLLEEDTK